MCIRMAFAIDSEARGCHINKEFWSAGHVIPNYHALQSLQS